jgi:hypothetical protein
MKHHKTQRRTRSLYCRRPQVSGGPPALNAERHQSRRTPAAAVRGTSSKDINTKAVSGLPVQKLNGTHSESSHAAYQAHTRIRQASQVQPPWGYALGPSAPANGVVRSANVVFPVPPTVAANSAPHYSRTFQLKNQLERDRDVIKRQQRLEVQFLIGCHAS